MKTWFVAVLTTNGITYTNGRVFAADAATARDQYLRLVGPDRRFSSLRMVEDPTWDYQPDGQ